MAKKKDNTGFYEKMMDAKKRKKEALERKQLEAEFEAHPERFNSPQPIIVKPDNELLMDAAFAQLQAKLKASQPPTQQEKIEQAFNDIARKAQGL